MKALSVRQPFASAIAKGEKKIEYRTWQTPYRGDLLIVSGKKYYEGLDVDPTLPLGVAICIVTLVDITEGYDYYEWHLANIRPVEPIPIKGKLGLFEVEF